MLLLVKFAICIIGCFVLILFYFSKEKKLPFKIVGLHFAILLFTTCNNVLYESNYIFHFPHLIRVIAPLGYLIGPLTYLFIRTLLNNESRLKRKDIFHFLPFLLHLLELLPFYFSSSTYKLGVLTSLLKQGSVEWVELTADVSYGSLHNLAKFLLTNIYLFYSYKIFLDFKKRAPKFVLIENSRLIRFASQFLWIKILAHSIVIVGIILILFRIDFGTIIADISITLVIALNIYLFILNPNLLYGMQYSYAYSNQNNDDFVVSGFANGSFDISIFIDKNYQVAHFNKAADEEIEAAFGIKIKKGDDVKKFLKGNFEKLFLKGISEALNGSSYEKEFFIKRINKLNNVWRLFSFRPIYCSKKEIIGVVFTSKDISKLKFNEIKISNFQKEFDGIVWRESHLLRAPVANLLGISSLLLKPESSINLNEKMALISFISKEVEKLDAVIIEIVKNASKLSKEDTNK